MTLEEKVLYNNDSLRCNQIRFYTFRRRLLRSISARIVALLAYKEVQIGRRSR